MNEWSWRVDSSYEWKTRLLLNETVSRCQLKSIDSPDTNLVVLQFQYAGIRIGPVVKRDVMKASIMLEHQSEWVWKRAASRLWFGWRGRKIFDNIKNPFESKKDALELLMDSRNELGSFGGDGHDESYLMCQNSLPNCNKISWTSDAIHEPSPTLYDFLFD